MKRRKKMMYLIIAALILVPFLVWIAFGYFAVRSVEMLGYEVIEKRDGYEIRQYPEHIIAKTNISGNIVSTGNRGFMTVADYIFGNNSTTQKVAMTTPVIQAESTKIAMTTPVIQNETNEYLAFVMPSEYSLEDLPNPNNDQVELEVVPPKKIAALRFSGSFSEKKYEAKKLELIEYLNRDGLQLQQIYSVGYNPPLTPPFMNRLEIWAEIAN